MKRGKIYFSSSNIEKRLVPKKKKNSIVLRKRSTADEKNKRKRGIFPKSLKVYLLLIFVNYAITYHVLF